MARLSALHSDRGVPQHDSPAFAGSGVRGRLQGHRRGATRILILGCAAVALISSTGCTLTRGLQNSIAYNEQTDDFVLGWRNQVWAKRAYNRQAEFLPVGEFPGSFREGFIAGYISVASGGNGCTPSLPPRKFWSWKYQSPEGQCKVNAWYEGFPYGAKAAEEDGLGNYRGIQVSARVEELMKQQNQGNYQGACLNCGPTPGAPQMANLAPTPDPSANLVRTRPPVPRAAFPPPAPRAPVPPPPVSPTTSAPVPAVPAAGMGGVIRPVSYEIERLPPVESSR